MHSRLKSKNLTKKTLKGENNLPKFDFNFERFRFDQLYSTFMGMSSREQTIALISGIGGLLLVIFLPVGIASGTLSSLQKQIDASEQELQQIAREVDQYSRAQAELKALENALSNGYDATIATTLEALAERSGIKKHLDSLKEKPTQPSETLTQSAVDVRLKQVKLKELIDFLHDIENDPEKILKLDQLEVKPRFNSKQDFDASFTVSTYRPNTTESAP